MTDERDLRDPDAEWVPAAHEPEAPGTYDRQGSSASPEGDDAGEHPAESAYRLGSERHGWFRPSPSLRARLQAAAGQEETPPEGRVGESHRDPAAPMPASSAADAPLPAPGGEGLAASTPPEVVDQPPPAPQPVPGAMPEEAPAAAHDLLVRQLEIERQRLEALWEEAEQQRQQLEDERRALEVVRLDAQRVLERAERMVAEQAGRPEPPDRSGPPVEPPRTVAAAPSVGPPPQTWEAASSTSIPPALAEQPPPVPGTARPEEEPAPRPSPADDLRSRAVMQPEQEPGGQRVAGEGPPATGGQAPGADLTLEEAARLYKFPIDRLRRRASSGGVPGAYTVTTAEGTEWRVPRAALAALGYRPVAEMELEREVRSRFGPDRVADDQPETEQQQVLQRPLPPKVQVRIAPGGPGHAEVTALRRQLDEERRQIETQKAEIQRAVDELEKQRTKDLERHRDELKMMLEKLVADRRQLEADRKRLTEQNLEEEFRLQREADRLAAEAAAQRARFEVERAELDEEWAEAEDRLERAERLETEHAAEQRRLEAARREIEREERRLRRRRERLDEERRQLGAERQQLDADRAELDAEREQLEEERADLALEHRRLDERAARRREPPRQPEPVRQREPELQPVVPAEADAEGEGEWRAPAPMATPARRRAAGPEAEPGPEVESQPEPEPEAVAEEPRPRSSRAERAARRQERSRQSFTAGRWKLAERTRVALSAPPEAEEAAKGSDGETAAAPRPRRAQGPKPNGGPQSSKFRVISPVWVDPEGQYCPPTHPVKAKLSSGLFHLPGMWAYDRTWPDRCYRDGEAAAAAGLTRAKR